MYPLHILTASPVIDCKEFRRNALAALPPDEPDPKQRAVDAVMAILSKQHDVAEQSRLDAQAVSDC